jgi:hypothetical protein
MGTTYCEMLRMWWRAGRMTIAIEQCMKARISRCDIRLLRAIVLAEEFTASLYGFAQARDDRALQAFVSRLRFDGLGGFGESGDQIAHVLEQSIFREPYGRCLSLPMAGQDIAQAPLAAYRHGQG